MTDYDLSLIPDGASINEEPWQREGVLSAVMLLPDGSQAQILEPVITFEDGTKAALSDFLEAQ